MVAKIMCMTDEEITIDCLQILSNVFLNELSSTVCKHLPIVSEKIIIDCMQTFFILFLNGHCQSLRMTIVNRCR